MIPSIIFRIPLPIMFIMPKTNPTGTNKAKGIVYPQAPFTKQYSKYSLINLKESILIS